MTLMTHLRFTELACPKCGASAGAPCKSAASGRDTYAHHDRRKPLPEPTWPATHGRGHRGHPQARQAPAAPDSPAQGAGRAVAGAGEVGREPPLSEAPPVPTERQSWFSGLGGR